MKSAAIARLVLLLAGSLHAELRPKRCPPAEHCTPPAGLFRLTGIIVPFDAPVLFIKEVKMPGERPVTDPIRGEIYWQFKKAGEPSRPCTAEDRKNTKACDKQIGDMYLTSPRFVMVEVEP